MRIARRILLWTGVLATVIGSALLLASFRQARADPVVRRASFAVPNWPVGQPPVRIVLASDIHVGSAAMDRARLTRIAAQMAALRPDLVLLAGDFIAGHDPADAGAAPALAALGALKPRFGMIAVLGNHDHWTSAAAVRRALAGIGATVLENEAVRRGPLAIAGIGDDYTRHARVRESLAALRRLRGVPIVLTHSPDLVPALPTGLLVMAGHSHCGQIVLPWYGPLSLPLRTDRRYLCGVIRDRGRVVIVTAGLGTSVLPLRLGAPPDVWLVEVGSPRDR